MEKEKGIKRRDFIKATGVGIAVAGLDLFSSDALAQEQKALEKTKDVAWVQARAKEHYFIERFN
jgi:Ni,Fe-hydrogenase I small subunit